MPVFWLGPLGSLTVAIRLIAVHMMFGVLKVVMLGLSTIRLNQFEMWDWSDLRWHTPTLFTPLVGFGLFVCAPLFARLCIPEEMAEKRLNPEIQRRLECFGIAAFGIGLAIVKIGEIIVRLNPKPATFLYADYPETGVLEGLAMVIACRWIHALLSRERQSEIAHNRS